MSRTAESRERPAEGHEPPDPVRSRILRGAARVFGERGYGASSVEAILEAAQVSRRTFYRTFRSKEDVLRTLFDNSVQMLVRAVRDATVEHRAARESQAQTQAHDLAAPAVDAYLRVHANAGPLARVLLLEQFSPGSPLAEQRNRAFATFSKLMTQASANAGRAPADPLLVAAVVVGRRPREASDPADSVRPRCACRRTCFCRMTSRRGLLPATICRASSTEA
jgi:AcrR family transcriptional regulator